MLFKNRGCEPMASTAISSACKNLKFNNHYIHKNNNTNIFGWINKLVHFFVCDAMHQHQHATILSSYGI